MTPHRTFSSARQANSLSRREWLRVGGLGVTGLTLPGLLRGTAVAGNSNRREAGFGRAKSCVIVFLKGGPSHIDTFDMKPDAPDDIRGEFQPIATSAPGIQVCEHLPRLARQADKYTVLRSVCLEGDAVHSTAAYEVTTGHKFPRPGESVMQRDDHPHFGSSVAAASGNRLSAPPFAMVPDSYIVNGQFRGGQNAGLLGTRFDPVVPGGDPNLPDFQTIDLGFASLVPPERGERRRRMLDFVNAQFPTQAPLAQAVDENYARALAMLASGQTREAFNIQAEPATVREKYGRNFFGQSVLLARRLVEAGVRLVHVNCMSAVLETDRNWDTHVDNFVHLKNLLLPRADQAIATLLDDLSQTGLLSETLVLVIGEFGRTPRIVHPPGKQAGRDHWPFCFSALMAGAGVAGGATFGRSDRLAAYPLENAVHPGHLGATLFHALGIPPETIVRTLEGRPYAIAEAPAIEALWS